MLKLPKICVYKINLNQLSKLSICSIIKTYKFDVHPPIIFICNLRLPWCVLRTNSTFLNLSGLWMSMKAAVTHST
jgi:hypothetical protein